MRKISKAVRTSNRAELTIYRQLQSEGWEVVKRGWPDFLAHKDGQLRFIEVKPRHSRLLGFHQHKVAQWLSLLGIIVEVLAPSDHVHR